MNVCVPKAKARGGHLRATRLRKGRKPDFPLRSRPPDPRCPTRTGTRSRPPRTLDASADNRNDIGTPEGISRITGGVLGLAVRIDPMYRLNTLNTGPVNRWVTSNRAMFTPRTSAVWSCGGLWAWTANTYAPYAIGGDSYIVPCSLSGLYFVQSDHSGASGLFWMYSSVSVHDPPNRSVST